MARECLLETTAGQHITTINLRILDFMGRSRVKRLALTGLAGYVSRCCKDHAFAEENCYEQDSHTVPC
jgi:hypothetical protein